MSAPECWPDAIQNPNATDDPNDKNIQCIMPLRYYDPDYRLSTLYSWLTYQPKSTTGSNPDLFNAAYGDVFSSNLTIADPDQVNQNRINLYQPKPPNNNSYKGLQWVSAIYPNASIFEDDKGNSIGPDRCPMQIQTSTGVGTSKNSCAPGCSYWAHEYNLENVYMENDANGNLVPKFPPRKALYGFKAQNKNDTEKGAGKSIKYGDIVYLYVFLLDIDPNTEKSVAKDSQTSTADTNKLFSSAYVEMQLLVQNEETYFKNYIILGQQSSPSGGDTFESLVNGTPAEFQIKSLNSEKLDGSDGGDADVVMSGDQFYLVQSDNNGPVKWETLQFSQAWHGENNQSLIAANGGHHSSWMYSNRYYWQGSVFDEGALQTTVNPDRSHQQWAPASTQGFVNLHSFDVEGPIVPTGSILLFGDNTSDTPAVHWFLDARSGNPQLDQQHTPCSADQPTCVDGQVCDFDAGFCTKPPSNAGTSHKVIMIAFLVIMAVVFAMVLYIGYRVHGERKSISVEQQKVNQFSIQ